MPTFRVPRDPPLEISYLKVIVDDPVCVIGCFEGVVTKDIDYVA